MAEWFHFEVGSPVRISSFLWRFSTVKVTIDKPHTNSYQYSLHILEQLFKAFPNFFKQMKYIHKWLNDSTSKSGHAVEKRQRSDEIRTGNPNLKWIHSAIYESVFICLAYLKRP